MGLRPPLMKYLSDGSREPIAILNEPGFPTEMEVDYVRVWQKSITTANPLEKANVNTLYQNYPNPVSGKTTIKYDIIGRSLVKLSIYNVNGKEIQIITNQIQNEGTYQKEIDLSGLNSDGTYFYKLQVGNLLFTKKLILNK